MTITKKLLGLLSLVIVLTTSGCIDFIEEITLRKDGSGEFKLTMDISQVFSSPMMESIRSEMGEENQASTEKIEMDSSMVFYDIMPDSIKKTMKEPEFWKKVKLEMNMSESKGVGLMGFVIDFEDLSDIDMFYKRMSELQAMGENSGNKQLGGIMNLFGGTMGSNFKQLYKLKRRKLTRFKQPKTPAEEVEEDENMAMMKMMMSGAKYKTIYHLPGKVKKASHPNAKINGKDVIVEVNLLDYQEGKVTLENEIKYKRK